MSSFTFIHELSFSFGWEPSLENTKQERNKKKMKKLGSLGYIGSPEIERGDNHKFSLQAIKVFDLVLKKKAIRKKNHILRK